MTRAHKNIRVLICDRQTLFRDGLKAIFQNRDPIQIVGEAGSATRAIDQVQHLRPDVVLMDVDLPDSSGFETMARILAIDPNIRILILNFSGKHHSQVARCLEAGASARIGRKVLPSQLQAAIMAAVGRRSPNHALASGH
jgi:DNA-binding NarL/FixJ family response regulator